MHIPIKRVNYNDVIFEILRKNSNLYIFLEDIKYIYRKQIVLPLLRVAYIS